MNPGDTLDNNGIGVSAMTDGEHTNDAKPDRIPVIADLVRDVAEGAGLELVDLYTLTEGRRELFGHDGLHPSAEGAKVIADHIFRRITDRC